MTKLQFNLFALRRQLEIHNGRRYTWRSISASTGIHTNTLANMTYNRTARADLANLAALLDYFAAEGMPVTIADLFTVSDE